MNKVGSIKSKASVGNWQPFVLAAIIDSLIEQRADDSVSGYRIMDKVIECGAVQAAFGSGRDLLYPQLWGYVERQIGLNATLASETPAVPMTSATYPFPTIVPAETSAPAPQAVTEKEVRYHLSHVNCETCEKIVKAAIRHALPLRDEHPIGIKELSEALEDVFTDRLADTAYWTQRAEALHRVLLHRGAAIRALAGSEPDKGAK